MTIHPTAIIDKNAKIAPDVEIGPNVIIGQDVEISSGVKVGAGATIEFAKSGENTKIAPYASICGEPKH